MRVCPNPHCMAPNLPWAKFCWKCGALIKPRCSVGHAALLVSEARV